MPSFLLCLAGLVVLTSIYSRINLWLRRRHFAASHGCKPLRQPRNLDPFLGIDHLAKVKKAVANHRFLEFWHRGHFASFGNTFEINLMGNPIIMTNEPENVQAILAGKFTDFEIGERRRTLSKQFAGIGLLNADGPLWEHSRALARPNFARSQIKLDLFEKHLDVWFDALPPEGTPLDWQDWAFRYASAHIFPFP